MAGFYLWEGLLLCWLSSSSSAQKTVNVSFPTLHFFSSSVCYFSCWLALWLTPWLTSTKQYCLSRPPPPHFPSLSLLLLLLPPAPLSPPFLILADFPTPIVSLPSQLTSTKNSLDMWSYLSLSLVDQCLASYWLNLNLTFMSIVSFQGSLGQIKSNVPEAGRIGPIEAALYARLLSRIMGWVLGLHSPTGNGRGILCYVSSAYQPQESLEGNG